MQVFCRGTPFLSYFNGMCTLKWLLSVSDCPQHLSGLSAVFWRARNIYLIKHLFMEEGRSYSLRTTPKMWRPSVINREGSANQHYVHMFQGRMNIVQLIMCKFNICWKLAKHASLEVKQGKLGVVQYVILKCIFIVCTLLTFMQPYNVIC